MKNSNKKGFTIVELVIVVAVIAILAAVLIPTFSGIIAKAQLSADTKAERDMNTALAIEQYPDNLDAVIDALVDNGFNADHLIPVSEGYAFAWNENTKKIELVKGELLAGYYDLKDLVKYIDVVAEDAETFMEAINSGATNVTLSGDVVLNNAVTIPAGTTAVVNFAGHTVTSNSTRLFNLSDGANLTINAEGATVNCDQHGLINVLAGADATVVVNGGTFNANYSTVGSFIRLRDGESDVDITLNNVTYIDNSTSYDSYISNIAGFEGNFNLTVNGGSYTSAYGFVCGSIIVKNATINTKSAAVQIDMPNSAVEIDGCTITVGNTKENGCNPGAALAMSKNGYGEIKNSTITQTGAEGYAYVIYSSGGEIVATNNTVTANETYKNLANASGSPMAATIGKITIDGVVVADKVND